MRGRWYRAVVVAALFVLLSGCTRPQGALALHSPTPSPTPVAGHDPLTITDVVLHSGEVGMAYPPVTLAATGGVAPYHWTVSVGALPAGLGLSPEGVISGMPSANGFFLFSVQVFDADSDTAGLPRTIGIVPRLTASLVPACATECAVELGCVTVCGTFGQSSGGASPLTYKLIGGTLPSGTSLSGMKLNGTFTGLPGRLSFTVQVTDAFGVMASLTPTFNMFPHISFPNGAINCPYFGCNGGPYAVPPQPLPYSGGSGTPTAKIIGWVYPSCPPTAGPCPPPPTPTVSASGGNIYITIPTSTGVWNGYKETLTILVTDRSPCSVGSNCSTSGVVTVSVSGN